MRCEFEQKQFEAHLDQELAARHSLINVSGQSNASAVGFDEAIFSQHPLLWNYSREPLSPLGNEILKKWFQEMEENIMYFPQFRCNVFIHHKRPRYLTRSNAIGWEVWKREFFRYQVSDNNKKQNRHEVLLELEDALEKNGIVVYASPTFRTRETLFAHIRQQSIVEHTNFQSPQNIGDHQYYTYAESGQNGEPNYVLPDPEPVEPVHLPQTIRDRISTEGQHNNNHEFLSDLASKIRQIMDGKHEPLFQRMINHYSYKYPSKKSVNDLLTINSFCVLYNLVWSVGIAPADLPE